MSLTGESSPPKITFIWLKTNELENNFCTCIPTNVRVFFFINILFIVKLGIKYKALVDF